MDGEKDLGHDGYLEFEELHLPQLQRIPKHLWKSLYGKLQSEVYDAGEYFMMSPELEKGRWSVVVSHSGGKLSPSDTNSVFLVDHAWTFHPHLARQDLLHIPGLVDRMTSLMDLNGLPCPSAEEPNSEEEEEGTSTSSTEQLEVKINNNKEKESEEEPCNSSGIEEDKPDLSTTELQDGEAISHAVDGTVNAMWKYCHPYSINNSPVPVWYIMDEFGSRIQHSDTPSVAMTPFFYVTKQLAFSLLWPVAELEFGDEVSRDYLPVGISGSLLRACHLLPWYPLTLDDPRWQEISQFVVPEMKERCNESIPDITQQSVSVAPPFKVYTDIQLVQSFLTSPYFQLTDQKEEANILWLSEHFKDFRSLLPHQFINQFACESVLTCKDLLAQVARKVCQSGASGHEETKLQGPSWLPETYNLLYELPCLVHRYLEKEENGDSNVWIVKPWNLGRGMDIHITASLNQIVRLAQAGPKIASVYITNPVLFNRPEIGLVKFDVRYVVLLKSVDPLELYVYNVFWLRFANRSFSLDGFDDYEKHFTVMNYKNDANLKQVHCDEFIAMFEEQYPDHPWENTQECIFSMLKELFVAACSAPLPAGIAPNPQCRAIYAVDLMLEWNKTDPGTHDHPSIQPKLLEVNYCPDCVRACRYHPSFFNHVFETLFLDGTAWNSQLPVTKLI